MKRFRPGELVKMLNLNSNADKLSNVYKGPYKIKSRVGSSHYDLMAVDGDNDDVINAHPVPIDQLAEWQRTDIIANSTDPTLVVKKILGHGIDDGILMYHVLWDDGSRSWARKEEFNDPDFVRRYHGRLRRSRKTK